jgi:hypothetical protein
MLNMVVAPFECRPVSVLSRYAEGVTRAVPNRKKGEKLRFSSERPAAPAKSATLKLGIRAASWWRSRIHALSRPVSFWDWRFEAIELGRAKVIVHLAYLILGTRQRRRPCAH